LKNPFIALTRCTSSSIIRFGGGGGGPGLTASFGGYGLDCFFIFKTLPPYGGLEKPPGGSGVQGREGDAPISK